VGAVSGSDPRIGSELAGYRLEVLLGRGGMVVVYRAHDLALGRNVALKILSPELAEDERFRERFLTESRLAASIDHPNVIPVYDAGEVAGQLYIAMRYVDGSDLKKLRRAGGSRARPADGPRAARHAPPGDRAELPPSRRGRREGAPNDPDSRTRRRLLRRPVRAGKAAAEPDLAPMSKGEPSALGPLISL